MAVFHLGLPVNHNSKTSEWNAAIINAISFTCVWQISFIGSKIFFNKATDFILLVISVKFTCFSVLSTRCHTQLGNWPYMYFISEAEIVIHLLIKGGQQIHILWDGIRVCDEVWLQVLDSGPLRTCSYRKTLCAESLFSIAGHRLLHLGNNKELCGLDWNTAEQRKEYDDDDDDD